MPISHKSYIHKPNDYTAPVDLNLLGRVLQFKEGEFNKGIQKTQQHLDAIAAMDVAKGEDKEYLNAKLTNLVNTVNGIGGADFSDPNVANQIAGLSSQVYGDENIINAVANTKRLRHVQNFYKEIKEKRPKDWNPANEWYDMNKFSGWLSDGKVGSSPESGAGSTTPYVDYMKDLTKTFGKLTANLSTRVTDKGLMYVTEKNEEVSPERIMQAASKMLTSNQKVQMGVEGRYTYQGVAPENILKAYDINTYNKVAKAQDELKSTEAKYNAATSLDDQRKYKALISNKQAEIEKLMTPVKNNLEQIKEKLYMDEKITGLAQAYSYRKSDVKLQPATDKMFKLNYDLNVSKFKHDQRQDAIGNQIDILDSGLMWTQDELGNQFLTYDRNSPVWQAKLNAGKGTKGLADENNSFITGIGPTDNSMADQKDVVSETKLMTKSNELLKTNQNLLVKFAQDLGWQKGDAEVFITDYMDDGNLSIKITPEMEKIAQTMKETIDAMATGKQPPLSQLPAGFLKYYKEYQKNAVELNAIQNTILAVENKVKKSSVYSGLPQVMKDNYALAGRFGKEFELINQKYPIRSSGGTGGGGFAVDPKRQAEVNALIKKYKQYGLGDPIKMYQEAKELNTKLDEEKAKEYSTYSNRFNMPSVIITDDKDKTLAKQVATVARSSSDVYDVNGKLTGEDREFASEKLTPVRVGYGSFEVAEGSVTKPYAEFEYKDKDGEPPRIRRVMLEPAVASQFGLQPDLKPMSGYNAALRLQGQTAPITTISGKDYQLRYSMVKSDPSSWNSPIMVRVYDQDGNSQLIKNPNWINSEQVEQFMENTATGYKTLEEALKDIAKTAQLTDRF